MAHAHPRWRGICTAAAWPLDRRAVPTHSRPGVACALLVIASLGLFAGPAQGVRTKTRLIGRALVTALVAIALVPAAARAAEFCVVPASGCPTTHPTFE